MITLPLFDVIFVKRKLYTVHQNRFHPSIQWESQLSYAKSTSVPSCAPQILLIREIVFNLTLSSLLLIAILQNCPYMPLPENALWNLLNYISHKAHWKVLFFFKLTNPKQGICNLLKAETVKELTTLCCASSNPAEDLNCHKNKSEIQNMFTCKWQWSRLEVPVSPPQTSAETDLTTSGTPLAGWEEECRHWTESFPAKTCWSLSN